MKRKRRVSVMFEDEGDDILSNGAYGRVSKDNRADGGDDDS